MSKYIGGFILCRFTKSTRLSHTRTTSGMKKSNRSRDTRMQGSLFSLRLSLWEFSLFLKARESFIHTPNTKNETDTIKNENPKQTSFEMITQSSYELVLTCFIKTRQVSNAWSNLSHNSLNLPHDLLITFLPRHTKKFHKDNIMKQRIKENKQTWEKKTDPFSTTWLSVSIRKFHLSKTSPVALLIITNTTLCNFPASSHSLDQKQNQVSDTLTRGIFQ